jgi:hypothetical protein
MGGRHSVEQQGRVTKLTKLTTPGRTRSGGQQHADLVPSLLTIR